MSGGLNPVQRNPRAPRLRAVAAAVAAAGMLVLAGGCTSGAGSSRPVQSAGPAPSVAAAEASCRHLTAAARRSPATRPRPAGIR